MAKKAAFTLVYADEVKEHLRRIDKKHHSLIQSEIEEQLSFQPELETRNRKPLRRAMSFGAQWELRLGPDNRFRAFYAVNNMTRTRCAYSLSALRNATNS